MIRTPRLVRAAGGELCRRGGGAATQRGAAAAGHPPSLRTCSSTAGTSRMPQTSSCLHRGSAVSAAAHRHRTLAPSVDYCRGGASPPSWPSRTTTHPPSCAPAVRTLSTTAAASSSSSSYGSGEQQKQEKKKSAADEPNIFLDNIGKIFLAAIGAIIVTLVRSSRGGTNKTNLRDYIENHALLDPLEIDDLRVANSDLTPAVFETIMDDVCAAFPSGRATYLDFVSVVIRTMRRLRGEAFTVQLGHLLDRVAIAAMEEEEEEESSSSLGDPTEAEMPLPLLFVILSLALSGAVPDRVRLLFEAMERSGGGGGGGGGGTGRVTRPQVVNMVGHLQRTCQLAPDAQIVQSSIKYPTQQYRRGTPDELVECADRIMAEEGHRSAADSGGGGSGGNDGTTYDLTEFHRLLRTKQVCAWGECYVKTKNIGPRKP